MHKEFYEMLNLHDCHLKASPCARVYALIQFLTKFREHITTVRACGYRRLHCICVWKIEEYIIALTTEFGGEDGRKFCTCLWPHCAPPRMHIPGPFVSKLQALLHMYAREPEWVVQIRRTLTRLVGSDDVVSYILAFAFVLPSSVDMVRRITAA